MGDQPVPVAVAVGSGLHMAGLVGQGHRVFVDDGGVGAGLATGIGRFVLVGNIHRAHKAPLN